MDPAVTTINVTGRLPPRIALVLGGGGLKGFAHIGVLRAIETLGVEVNVFAGSSIGALIAAAHVGGMSVQEMGERAGPSLLTGGIWPRNRVEVRVDRERCTGCTLCVSQAPQMMRMDGEGKAEVLHSPVEWSRAEGEFVHQCPTAAIRVRSLGRTPP